MADEEVGDLRSDIEDAFSDPAESDPAESDPADSDLADSDPAESDPAESDPAESDPADSDPAESDTADSDPADSDPAYKGAADSNPADDKGVKAPASWSAENREKWSKVPVELKTQILARERETEKVMRESVQSRRVHSQISKLAHAYAPIMAAEGVNNPVTAIEGMFKTVAQLRSASPQQKAAKMAQLIQHYGVDIGALDDALVGTAADSQDNRIEQLVNQRMQPVNQLMQQFEQQKSQAAQQQRHAADQEVQQFGGEFLSDVRMDMADLIDMASSRGVQMTLQEAYDKAVILKPGIQAVLEQRRKDAQLLDAGSNKQRRRAASGSITGGPGDAGSAHSGDSIRGALMNAFEEAD